MSSAAIEGALHVGRFLTPVPYRTNADLPDQVKGALPADAQTRFRQVVNAALDRGLSESKAFASAWSVVRNGWEKPKDGEGKWIRKAEPRTLFVQRKLENADEFIAWAKDQGFNTTLLPGDIHVTVAYSKEPLDWPEPLTNHVTIRSRRGRTVEALGDNGAVVLRFSSPILQSRFKEFLDAGASYDFDSYKPHVTISWKADDIDPDTIEPFDGDLVFGPEVFKEVNMDFDPSTIVEKGSFAKASVFKVSEELGLVFGWAIVCKHDGECYYDVQGDHIPEESMLKAAADFMEHSRVGGDMHKEDGEQALRGGSVVFAFPLTSDIAKAMGIETKRTGLMIAYKPDSQELLEKFKLGEYTGFSIGGTRVTDEEIA